MGNREGGKQAKADNERGTRSVVVLRYNEKKGTARWAPCKNQRKSYVERRTTLQKKGAKKTFYLQYVPVSRHEKKSGAAMVSERQKTDIVGFLTGRKREGAPGYNHEKIKKLARGE